MGESEMRQKARARRHQDGFTLIEALIGIVLIAIAVLGLAEVFTLSLLNNLRAERVSNGSFLAQQQADMLRSLTQDELNFLSTNQTVDLNGDGNPDISLDELLDLNLDGLNDYRRITNLQVAETMGTTTTWEVTIMVFSQEQFQVQKSDLLQNPQLYRLRGRMDTIIAR
jgi:prepilin-type N-terminal cleavage/methylation domain-containing protein